MILNLTFYINNHIKFTIVYHMSWPSQLPYLHTTLYTNTLNHYPSPVYFPTTNENRGINNFSDFFIYFSSENPIIINQFTPNQSFNFQSLTPLAKFAFENSKNQKQSSQIKISEQWQSRPEGNQYEVKNQEKGENQLIGTNGQEKVKKQKNLISHNCSLRNDTKNIPKNYGKAMLSYIQKNTRQVKQILSKQKVDHLQFLIFVKSYKSKINTIHDLRQMWGENEKDNKIMKCVRILSYHFMRKKCLPYIFNSRIKNLHTHIKYRRRIMEGIENPQNFTKIKQF